MGAAGDDLNMDGRVLPVEIVQIGQEEQTCHRVTGADRQLPHLQLTGLIQFLLPIFQKADGTADVFVQHFPLAGQGDAPAVPGKKTGLQFPLQLLNGLADSGLGNIQGLGGGGDVSGFGNLFEYAV